MANSDSKNSKNKREDYQKKKVNNQKSMRGQAETEYGEIKTPMSFSLTETGGKLIKQKAKELGISASALLEQIARGEIQVTLAVPGKSDVNSESCA
jgi:uncharacterized protein YgiM (DUF1202 family)